ncbi:MAG: carbohydrate porin [Acidobacteriota bacterium]|nr:carbohydrate porin [Acidobacteriota bacterium]
MRLKLIFAAALLLCACSDIRAESPTAIAPAQTRSIEDLNYLGGEAAMPLFTDNMVDIHSRFRQGMFRKGLAFRVNGGPQYTQNLLDAPVAADQQVYVGQRAYEAVWVQPILSWDMRQLNLHRAQLYSGAVWNWVTWNPAGPKALQLWALYFYKEFGRDRVELKTGYIAHNMNFVGLFVGGSTATGTQGVYAVLPYEAGMSFFPLPTPALDLKVNGPRHTYYKGALQRSMDPKGGPTEVSRNHTGFRFAPHGDKLVTINEVGYSRVASAHVHEAWFRAGYIGNASKYTNAVTGEMEKGNHCAYVLMDGQLVQTNGVHPEQGLYGGVSYMTVPEKKNAYARYYEARLYQNAPFRSRPTDVAAVVASHTEYSPVFTDNLVAQGKTVWRASTTVTGSYSLHAAPGNYISLGLGYLYGPAITPHVDNALTFTATWNFFF